MKYAIIILSGAVDGPVEELGGRTPLEAATLPVLDDLAARGRLGSALTVPPGEVPRSEVALLNVLGYDPAAHPVGRGRLEARAAGIELGPDDAAFRCNLVTVVDGKLRDFTAGYIDTAQAEHLLDALNEALEDDQVHLYPGASFRNLFVWRQAGLLSGLRTEEPQFALDEDLDAHLPRGPDSEPLRRLVRWSQRLLDAHDANAVRRDLGENPANAVWVYGHGAPVELPSYAARFGLRGVLVAGTLLARGLARAIGWDVRRVPGATGLLDSDLVAKGRAAVAAVAAYDLVCVHVEAADEASHMGDAGLKVRTLEAIDRHVVAPLLDRLERESAYRVLVMPDHATSVATRRHTGEPTIFVMAGAGIASNRGAAFDESSAAMGELHVERAWELMDYFLRR